jgi:hypothetical protein
MRAWNAKSLNEVLRGFENTLQGEMVGPDDEDTFMALRHLPMVADEFLRQLKAHTSEGEGDAKGAAAPGKK